MDTGRSGPCQPWIDYKIIFYILFYGRLWKCWWTSWFSININNDDFIIIGSLWKLPRWWRWCPFLVVLQLKKSLVSHAFNNIYLNPLWHGPIGPNPSVSLSFIPIFALCKNLWFYLFTARINILPYPLTLGSNSKLPIDWLVITQNYKQSDN